jgi:small subunit ribosomal protein S17
MSHQAKTFIGFVVSTAMKGTIVVILEHKHRHPFYQKIIKRSKKIYVDNNLAASLGDLVKVAETRPLSKLKRFTTVEILKKH